MLALYVCRFSATFSGTVCSPLLHQNRIATLKVPNAPVPPNFALKYICGFGCYFLCSGSLTYVICYHPSATVCHCVTFLLGQHDLLSFINSNVPIWSAECSIVRQLHHQNTAAFGICSPNITTATPVALWMQEVKHGVDFILLRIFKRHMAAPHLNV